jgi:hypothetical protein
MEPILKLKSSISKSIEIQIVDTGVFVIEKSLTDYHEYLIDFDNFSTKKTVKREINNSLLFFVFAFSIITLIKFFVYLDTEKGLFGTSIFFLIALAFLFSAIITKKQTVTLTNLYDQDGLKIPFKKTNEKYVREFADLIISKTKEYLILKYGKVDKDLPREGQFEKIISLKDRNVITEQEFERLKKVLADKDSDKKIGF